MWSCQWTLGLSHQSFFPLILTLKLYFQESPPVSSTAAIKNMKSNALQKPKVMLPKHSTHVTVWTLTLDAHPWEPFLRLQITFLYFIVSMNGSFKYLLSTFAFSKKNLLEKKAQTSRISPTDENTQCGITTLRIILKRAVMILKLKLVTLPTNFLYV